MALRARSAQVSWSAGSGSLKRTVSTPRGDLQRRRPPPGHSWRRHCGPSSRLPACSPPHSSRSTRLAFTQARGVRGPSPPAEYGADIYALANTRWYGCVARVGGAGEGLGAGVRRPAQCRSRRRRWWRRRLSSPPVRHRRVPEVLPGGRDLAGEGSSRPPAASRRRLSDALLPASGTSRHRHDRSRRRGPVCAAGSRVRPAVGAEVAL